jgi:hypothetical protein
MSLDLHGYVKFMEDVWRRIEDVNVKLPDELVVFMTSMDLLPFFGPRDRCTKQDLSTICVESS